MGELIHREAAAKPQAFTGERMTGAASGQIEIEHYHRYLLAREFCRDRDVLDLGAGEGYGTALLAQVARSAIGIDIDPATVAAARVEFDRPNLRFEQGDARALELPDDSVDVVVCFETLEHFAEHAVFLAEVRRVLRADGLLIASTPDRDAYSPLGAPPNPYHRLELTAAEFESLLRQHFPKTALAAQRAFIGSAILGVGHTPLRTYERRGETVIEGSDSFARAPYLVALASDAELPALPNSVFVSRSDLDTDGEVRHEAELGRLAAEERANAAEIHFSDLHDQMLAALKAAREAAEREATLEQAVREGLERERESGEREANAVRHIEALDQAIATLKRAIAEGTAREANAVRYIATLERAVESAAEREEDAAGRIQELEASVETAGEEIARLQEETDAEIARLQQDNAELTNRLMAIETSSTWRATRPFRSIGRRSPRLARGVRRGMKLAWWTITLQLPRRYLLWRKYRLSRLQPVEALAGQPLLPDMQAPDAAALSAEASAADAARLEKRPLLASEIAVPFSREPVVSVIIPGYGQVEVTLACLASIAEHPPRTPIEVIVVDDAYPDTAELAPLGDVQGIQLVRNPTNLGFLLSCNRAARGAKGRYIHFLNNDTELQPGSIDALVELLDSRPEAGMAGSKLLYPDGLLQEAGGIIWADASGWNFGKWEDPSRPEFNYLREVDYCSGASVMVRRSVFEALGGFDEAFAPAYYEDADLAFRIRERGMKVFFEPRSMVIHHEGVSHGTDVTAGVKSYQLANQARMVERWAATLSRENYENGQHVLRARDRARHRKVILVIETYTLQPDRDAGSRSTMCIIESLLEAGWVVKFWPCNRAYDPIYTPAMERRGIEVLDHRFPDGLATWLRENRGDLDHVLVCRPDVAAEVLADLMRDADAVLSYYGHDLHFARMQRQARLDPRPDLLEEAAMMERLERRLWRHFDVVMYPSEEEAVVVRALHPGTIVRSIVPFHCDTFAERTRPTEGRTILFVGGFAHPPNVDAANFLLREIVPLLEDEVGPVTITLAGSSPTEEVRALASENVTVTGYLSDEALGALYYCHRVSVVPLRFGAGVKGKVVESLARGLPLVTTTIGAQGIPGIDAIVPVHDDAPSIVRSLKLLLTDDDAWVGQSSAQMAFAQRRFAKSAVQASVLAALEAGEKAAAERKAAGTTCEDGGPDGAEPVPVRTSSAADVDAAILACAAAQ